MKAIFYNRSMLLSTLIMLCYSLLNGQTFVESNLPIIRIQTSGLIPSEIKATADMKIAYNESGNTKLNGPYNIYDGKIGIEFRGSSSLGLFPKNGYAVETRNDLGENLNIPILGMPEENDWTLHGPYSDKTLMRNALAYSMAADIMDYAPRIRFCELVINDEYLGVYLLTEKIKRDKSRVDLPNLNPDENDGDDVTGGYILKFDKFDGEEVDGFRSEYFADPIGTGTTIFQYHYPKPSEITADQKLYIQDYIKNLEDILKSEDYKDPETGYRKFLDTQSFIELIFVNEIAKNVDGYRLSTYMYKDKDSVNPKLKMGPVWDFNLGFGNADYCTGGDPIGLVFQEFNKVCQRDNWIVHFWWQRLWDDPSFKTELGNKWVELRKGKLSTEHLIAKVDSFQNLLQEPQVRNFERWPTLGMYVWPNYRVHFTYDAEVTALRNFLRSRLDYLDTQFADFASSNDNLLPEESLAIFPNPVQDVLHLNFAKRSTIPGLIQIFDNTGQLVKSIDNPEKNPDHLLNWSSFHSGLYYLKASTATGKYHIRKIIKQ